MAELILTCGISLFGRSQMWNRLPATALAPTPAHAKHTAQKR